MMNGILIALAIVAVLTILICLVKSLSNFRIKVDYSKKAKETGLHDIPGEFAVYTKKGLFERWVEDSTYADFHIACIVAERIRKQHNQCPKYF